MTMAWDLPAGGLWIGLPLAAAAIVVGIGARRGPTATAAGRRIAAVAIVVAALCALSMPVYLIAGALSSTPAPRRLGAARRLEPRGYAPADAGSRMPRADSEATSK